jgi:hypothetical protein
MDVPKSSSSSSSRDLQQPSTSSSSSRPSGPVPPGPGTDRIDADLARRQQNRDFLERNAGSVCISCRHVPPHRMDRPTWCVPMVLPVAAKKEEGLDEDDIVVLAVKGCRYDEVRTRAILLKRPRARSLSPPPSSSDQQQHQQSATSPSKRSRDSSPTSTVASPPRIPVIDRFDPALLTSYRLRLSLIPFGEGSEVYASTISSLDLGSMAAVVPLPRPQQQQQDGQQVGGGAGRLRVRQDIYDETSSCPALGQEDRGLDSGEEGGGGGSPR